MDTSTTIQNNHYHLWTEQQKQERTKNNIHPLGVIKKTDNRTFYTFTTGIKDGVSFTNTDTGTVEQSSQIEKM